MFVHINSLLLLFIGLCQLSASLLHVSSAVHKLGRQSTGQVQEGLLRKPTMKGLAPQPRKGQLQLLALDPAFDDEDSSGGETGSSTSMAEMRVRLLDRERKEDQDRSLLLKRSLKLHLEKDIGSTVMSSSVPAITTKPIPLEPAPMQTQGLSAAQGIAGQTFDFGLVLAFPVIIGTLALFFIFPLIKDQLGATLPPVPLGPT